VTLKGKKAPVEDRFKQAALNPQNLLIRYGETC